MFLTLYDVSVGGRTEQEVARVRFRSRVLHYVIRPSFGWFTLAMTGQLEYGY
jgi:hypothetical protein